MMYHVFLVAAGGAIGAVLRHLTNLAAMRAFGSAFPWGTLGVNVVGCFTMGLFIELLARRFGDSNEIRLFVATGLLGGFTTFSAFSLDFVALYQRAELLNAFIYVTASVLISILALFLGLWVAKNIG